MRVVIAIALLLLFSRESVANVHYNCAPRNDSFSDVLKVRKDAHSSPNLDLLEETFVEAYNIYVSYHDCDAIHRRQVETVHARILQDNDREVEFHVEGTCVGCESFQGLFDYNLDLEKENGCKCGYTASDKLPTERAFVEYLNQVLQDSFGGEEESMDSEDEDDESSFLDDHVLYSARKLDASCPLGDDRLDCLLDKQSFTQNVQVTFGTGEDDLEIPSTQQLELLGEALVELYNDYACRINDPRIVCSSTLVPGNANDFVRSFEWKLKYDQAVAPSGLSQVFGAPELFMPTSETERQLLSDKFDKTCWLATQHERLAVYPANFGDFVNGQLPWLVKQSKYKDLEIFSYIVSVSDDTPEDAVDSLLQQGLLRTLFSITVDEEGSDVTLDTQLGIDLAKEINRIHREICDPLRIVKLIDFTTDPSSRRRLGSGTYNYDSNNNNGRVGCGGCSRRRMLNDEIFDESLETCGCLSMDPPRKATIDDYQGIKDKLGVNIDIIEVIRNEPDPQGCPDGPSELIIETGFVDFGRELTAEEIPEVEFDLCLAQNLLYEQACPLDYRECIQFILSVPDEGDDRLLGKNTRRLNSSYKFSQESRCRAKTCEDNDRVGGGRRKLFLSNQTLRPPRGLYSSLCVCASESPTYLVPSPEELLDKYIQIKTIDVTLNEIVQDRQDETCERNDEVLFQITVEADLTTCAGENVTENFCLEIEKAYNNQSEENCDPTYTLVTFCELESFSEVRRLTENGHRRLGTYTHNVGTSGRNERVGSGRRLTKTELVGVKPIETQGFQFGGERMLEDSPVEQCRCISDNATFTEVTLEEWTERLELELQQDRCPGAQVNDIEIVGYPAPCNAENEACSVQFEAELDETESIGLFENGEFFKTVYGQLVNMNCDYFQRRLNVDAVSVSFDGASGKYTFTVPFSCLDGCVGLLGQPSVFDTTDIELFSTCGAECPDLNGNKRAPTLGEFVTEWNTLNVANSVPALETLTPLDGTGFCDGIVAPPVTCDGYVCPTDWVPIEPSGECVVPTGCMDEDCCIRTCTTFSDLNCDAGAVVLDPSQVCDGGTCNSATCCRFTCGSVVFPLQTPANGQLDNMTQVCSTLIGPGSTALTNPQEIPCQESSCTTDGILFQSCCSRINDSCIRDDTTNFQLTVPADLVNCQGSLEEDFSDLIQTVYNRLSAENCDPTYTLIDSINLTESSIARRLENGRRRLGTYTHNAGSSGRNKRVGSGRRRLDGVNPKTAVQEQFLFGSERMLDGSEATVELCECRSTNPTYMPVTLDQLREALELELQSQCENATVEEPVIDGYPVPCEADNEACSVQFEAVFVGEDLPTPSVIEDFFKIVYDSLATANCDYFERRTVESVSVSLDELSGSYSFTVPFVCLDGCYGLPGQQSVFDTDDIVVLPCLGIEECSGTKRAPTLDEFVAKWNSLNEGSESTKPDLASLTPIEGTGQCSEIVRTCESDFAECPGDWVPIESNGEPLECSGESCTENDCCIPTCATFSSCNAGEEVLDQSRVCATGSCDSETCCDITCNSIQSAPGFEFDNMTAACLAFVGPGSDPLANLEEIPCQDANCATDGIPFQSCCSRINDSCERDDTTNFQLTVPADLVNCQGSLEEDFSSLIQTVYNRLSAENCDPTYTLIDSINLTESSIARRLENGRRRLGTYTHNAGSSGRNKRVGSGRRRLDGVNPKIAVQEQFLFGSERMLDGSEATVELCECRSTNPTYMPVTLEQLRDALELELESQCENATVLDPVIDGYRVPCEADYEACSFQLLAQVGGETNSDDLATFFESVYTNLTDTNCDYFERFLTGSVSASETLPEYTLNVTFGCVDGCEGLPGQPSIFDTSDILLLPCGSGECNDSTGNKRAPTVEEFISKWNELSATSPIPDITSVTPVEGSGICRPTCSSFTGCLANETIVDGSKVCTSGTCSAEECCEVTCQSVTNDEGFNFDTIDGACKEYIGMNSSALPNPSAIVCPDGDCSGGGSSFSLCCTDVCPSDFGCIDETDEVNTGAPCSVEGCTAEECCVPSCDDIGCEVGSDVNEGNRRLIEFCCDYGGPERE